MPSSTSSPPSAADCDANCSAPRNSESARPRSIHEEAAARPARAETDLEVLARILVDLHRAGMRSDDVQVLYAHHVLGYSIAELAAMTGRDRRALYARRDRGQRRLCA